MKKTLLLLLILICCLSSCTQKAESNVYGTLNGEEITAEETEYFRTCERAEIINEFAAEYGITDFSDFWDKEFGGTTPAEELEKRAFEEACKAKIKLVLMREKGIYEDISFSALKQKAVDYNEEHEGKNNTVGINSVDLSRFYTYYISTGEMELKNALGKDELKPTEEEISAYRESHSEELTDEGVISFIVDEKYEDYIVGLLNTADIKREEN